MLSWYEMKANPPLPKAEKLYIIKYMNALEIWLYWTGRNWSSQREKAVKLNEETAERTRDIIKHDTKSVMRKGVMLEIA